MIKSKIVARKLLTKVVTMGKVIILKFNYIAKTDANAQNIKRNSHGLCMLSRSIET